MSGKYQIVEHPPTVEAYRALSLAVGWEEVVNFDAVEMGLRNSLHHVLAYDGDQLVGMGRIVGDGATFFCLQDIAVHPDYQAQAVERHILERLVGYLKEHAPRKAFIGLFATKGTEPFYEQYGFRKATGLVGMVQMAPIEKQ